jgi:hypothetical protein
MPFPNTPEKWQKISYIDLSTWSRGNPTNRQLNVTNVLEGLGRRGRGIVSCSPQLHRGPAQRKRFLTCKKDKT